MRSLVALGLGALAIMCVVTLMSEDPTEDTVLVSAWAKKAAAKTTKKVYKPEMKGEGKLRKRISDAIKVAAKSLRMAKTPSQKKAAKIAVKKALADAGVADSDNAGTIAWANRNLDSAKKWAVNALKNDAKALGKVEAWTAGDRTLGLDARRKCERAVQAMIAVAGATKNKEMVARDAKHRTAKKLASYDAPIRNARKAAEYAQKSVGHARAALAATLGDKARIMARHALIRAEGALNDANTILQAEVKRKNVVTSDRLQSDGARLVGENELHFQARKTYHKANRILKLVQGALNRARKNHYAHKEAVLKQQQKTTMEKAAKLAHTERKAKTEARMKKLGIKTKQEYAAHLAQQALKFGELARDDAKKAAKAGKIAAKQALESAHVKEDLGVKNVTSTATVTEALERENIAADLAAKAAKMEDAIVTGGKIPKIVQELLMDDSGTNMKPSVLKAARVASMEAHTDVDMDDDFHTFVNHRDAWKAHYDKMYKDQVAGKALDDLFD